MLKKNSIIYSTLLVEASASTTSWKVQSLRRRTIVEAPILPHYASGRPVQTNQVSLCPLQNTKEIPEMDTAQTFVACALYLELRSEDQILRNLDTYFSTNFFLTVLRTGSITCSIPRYLYGSSLLAAGTVRSSESTKEGICTMNIHNEIWPCRTHDVRHGTFPQTKLHSNRLRHPVN